MIMIVMMVVMVMTVIVVVMVMVVVVVVMVMVVVMVVVVMVMVVMVVMVVVVMVVVVMRMLMSVLPLRVECLHYVSDLEAGSQGHWSFLTPGVCRLSLSVRSGSFQILARLEQSRRESVGMESG